jgi:predicted DNA binding CopG/RHH family protein
MRKPKLKPIPKFASEAAEREFWATADTTEYFDWSKARPVVFPNLKPTTTPISVRLPETLLLELKRLANERDVPYQSLLKVYLAERVAVERGIRARQRPHQRLQPTKARRNRPRNASAR